MAVRRFEGRKISYPFLKEEGENMASFKINTGIKTYDIENENAVVIGQIRINTTDMNMFYRAKETEEKIKKLIEDITENVSTEEDMIKATYECDQKIKEEINKLFDDDNLSQAVFGNQSCLSTLNGVTFVERFLNMVMPTIQEDFKEEMKKSNDRVKRYTSQVK